ncbi:MAG: hypothetical protein CL920_02425 [Deltaproteobacteria bacterium]|nr:hypothetical protein [Deltaproteobacteria bacterium]
MQSSARMTIIGFFCLLLSIVPGGACVPQICSVDFECTIPTPYCLVGVCKECLESAHCGVGMRCVEYKCVPLQIDAPPAVELPASEPFEKQSESTPKEPTITPEEEQVASQEVSSPEDAGEGREPDENITPEPVIEFVPECQEGETRECYTAKSGCLKDAGGKWVCKGQCKVGSQSCTNGRWSVACTGQSTPSTDLCDGVDRNCDGSVACSRVSVYTNYVDYAVNDSQQIVSLSLNANRTQAKVRCFPKGPFSTPVELSIASNKNTNAFTAVRVLWTKGLPHFIVAWSHSKPSFGVSFRAIDANCKLKTSPKFTYTGFMSDLAVDKKGRIALFQWGVTTASKLHYLAADGSSLKVMSNPGKMGCSFFVGLRMNPSGEGVLVCRQTVKPFALQVSRFTFLNTPASAISATDSDVSNVQNGYVFTPGINDKGDIIVVSQDLDEKVVKAFFWPKAGSKNSKIIHRKTGRGISGTTIAKFPAYVGLLGDDFVIQEYPAKPATQKWYRYTPAGKLVKTYSNNALPESVRTAGNDLYLTKPGDLHIFRVPKALTP